MNKTLFVFSFPLFFNILFVSAQNVGIGTNSPKAALDVSSTTGGFLPPRMTYAQRNTIVNPISGLIVFCTDCGKGEMQYFNGTGWLQLATAVASIPAADLPSVTIDGKVWSSKNLDVVTYKNGDPIPQVSDPTEWAGLTTGAWCYYNNDPSNNSKYGKLYNWYAVNDPRGLAPQGWHVATNTEWNKMTKYLDPTVDTTSLYWSGTWNGTNIGLQLKNLTGWQNAGNGNNSSDFSALPGGYRSPTGNFFTEGFNGYWWSSTEYDVLSAFFRGLESNSNQTNVSFSNKRTAGSVRVLKD